MVYIDPNDQQSSQTAAKNAVAAWNTVLQGNATGFVGISYGTTSDASQYQNANVEFEDSTTEYLAQDQGGTVGGTNTFLQFSSGYTSLVNSQVIINAGQDAMTTYVIAVHELGHAFGLNHSRYQRSVMYPTTSTCLGSTTDTRFDYADASFLENSYDPGYVTNNTSARSGCGGTASNPTESGKTITVLGTDVCDPNGNNSSSPKKVKATLFVNGNVAVYSTASAPASRSFPAASVKFNYTCPVPGTYSFLVQSDTLDGDYTSSTEYFAC